VSGFHANEAEAVVFAGVAVVVVDVDVDIVDVDVAVVDVGVKMVEVGVEMVKVTGRDCGVFVAPPPVTVIVVEYVPAASPELFTVAVNEPGAVLEAVPELGESESHGAVVLTLQFNVPFPELEMVTVCTTGVVSS
jgi:hypothetical protein